MRIEKINTIVNCPVNKLFVVENTYDTNQTYKASHKEIASPFPCCSVNREYSERKTRQKKGKFCFSYNILRTDFRNMMAEERLNALLLLCIHRNMLR